MQLPPKIFSRKSGFTIVELLIVIVIVGILSTLVIITYNSIQARTRDSARIHSIKSLQKAVEAYYIENGQYPLSANGSGNWAGHCPNFGNYDTYIIGISSYLSRLPTDPKYDASWNCYLYRSNGTDYMILAHMTMENICGGDPSDACNSPEIRALDRPANIQPTIAVYSPGATWW